MNRCGTKSPDEGLKILDMYRDGMFGVWLSWLVGPVVTAAIGDRAVVLPSATRCTCQMRWSLRPPCTSTTDWPVPLS